MKPRISVNLPEKLVNELDKLVGQYGSRSAIIEQAIRVFLDVNSKTTRDTRDLEILNRRADSLNAEAKDVLQYQINC